MQCNIDQTGVRFRRAWGIMVLLVATVVAGLAWWSGIGWLWWIVGAAALAGGFAIFESSKKWCALRAMGIKTRI